MNSIDGLLKFGEASARNPRTFWAVRRLYEFHRFGIKNAKGLYFFAFLYEKMRHRSGKVRQLYEFYREPFEIWRGFSPQPGDILGGATVIRIPSIRNK